MHAPGMPGTYSTQQTSKKTASYRSWHASRHVRHARAVIHVGSANTGWRGRRFRHSRRMRNPQSYVSGKRPMVKRMKERTLPSTKCFQTVFMIHKYAFLVCIINQHGYDRGCKIRLSSKTRPSLCRISILLLWHFVQADIGYTSTVKCKDK